MLKGSTVNTNLAFIGSKLLENGLTLDFSLEIRDRGAEIVEALDEALARADLVITSGGLGPTADDMTRECIARRFGAALEPDGEAVLAIRRYWKIRHNGEPAGRIMNQSLVPRGATVLLNRTGTAPGLVMKTPANDRFPGKTVILLPGPPGEIRPMFEEDVLPLILKLAGDGGRVHSRVFYVCGAGESEIEDRMVPVMARTHPLSVAYCATHEYVKLFLLSSNMESLGSAIDAVRREFGPQLLTDGAEGVAWDVVRLLKERSLSVSMAESCTGGLVAKMITDVSGASDVFPGSVVSYANRIKEQILGVKHETLERFGAVSPQTAREMADGAVRVFGTDCSVALTGIAGPGGGTPEKPVGLVYVAVRCPDRCEIFELHLSGTRGQIRERAASRALNELRLMLLENGAGKPC